MNTRQKTRAVNGLACLLLVGLQFLASAAMAQALDGSATWSGQCASCHDVSGNGYRPNFGSGPSNALATSLNTSSTAFRAYIQGLASSTQMATITPSDAAQARAYLVQKLYGRLTGADFTFSGDPLPEASYQFTGNVVNTENGAHPVLSIKNNRSNGPIAYALSGIPGTAPSSGYWYTDDPSCASGQIPANGTCQVSLSFKPNAVSTASASLVVTIGGVSQTISLSAQNASVPLPTLSWRSLGSTALHFGSVATNTASTALVVTLENNDSVVSSSATLSSINFSDTSNFTISGCRTSGGALVTLAHGESCQITVQFTPGSAGLKSAILQIASDGNPPAQLSFDGTGVDGPPQLSVSDASIAFGVVKVGSHSDPIDLRLSSGISSPVRVTGFVVSGAYSYQNKDCPALPFDLQRGSSCTITVSFNPAAVGTAPGTLSIASDSAPALADISLSGQGEAPAKTSGGGCSLASGDSPFDPMLWALTLGAALVLARRRALRSAQGTERHSSRHPS